MIKEDFNPPKKKKLIQVFVDDDELLMTRCRELYINEYPEMANVELSRKFMFKKVVKFYIDSDG